MKDSYLINFNLFCQRRGFSLSKFLSNNPDTNYNDFRIMLTNIKVRPPSEEVFNKIAEELASKKDLKLKEKPDLQKKKTSSKKTSSKKIKAK
tara:strand:- start:2560 stop:2835 length:276 start_codon:yes stop_codon:yes gene_type:complete